MSSTPADGALALAHNEPICPTSNPIRQLSRADAVMCKILCIPDEGRQVSKSGAQRLFSTSVLISAARCLLSYVVLPIITPLVGVATSVGPAIGIPIAVVALFFDVKGMRRFFLAGHKSRWMFAYIYFAVIALVLALLAINIVDLVR